jgi:murein DD-endopeptidase MepM/ murein hydrolase activator NlpD
MRDAGLPSPLAHELIRALGHEVDFQREFRRGDGFAVLFTKPADRHSAGELLHAEFTLAGRRLALWRYDTERGPEWFDESGRSLRRAFLRTPLDGARLSSGFGLRPHPVLGFNRVHQGVDFAAPAGTPVYAAGDGVVEFVGRNRGYGKFVRIRHNGDYGTGYGHLSRFAARLAPGTRVAQGQVIGYVGATGLATGPHLHYEVLKDGAQINPQGLKLAFADRLDGAELRRFRQLKAQIDAQRAEPVLAAASQ